MKLVVVCNESQKAEFLSGLAAGADVFFAASLHDIPAAPAVLFDLLFDGSRERIEMLKTFLPAPVFVNAVTQTLSDIQQPFIRINAWPGFLQRPLTEMVALPAQQENVRQVFDFLQKKYKLVPDWPGMVSARIVAMIINEAYFTFGDGVSSREEIDLAMKAGTNYPYGPFEWAGRIGLHRIYELLMALSAHDNRYQPAPALTAEADNLTFKKA